MVALLVLGVSIGFALFFGALLTSGLYLFFSNSAENFIRQEESILMHEVAKDTKLENGTKQYERWIKQPLILESKIYLFNITNPEEIKSGAMPIVSEVGPFVYEKHLYKKEIVNNKSDILQYNQYWSMTFRKDLSFNSHNLKITYLNTPLNNDQEEVNSRTKNEASKNLRLDDTFASISIQKLQGNPFCDDDQEEADPDEDEISIAMFIYCNQVKNRAPVDFTAKRGNRRPSKLNDNLDSQFQISAGTKDITRLGEIRAWKGKPYIGTWGGGHNSKCNKLQGTDSTIYAPGVFSKKEEETIVTFSSDICRKIEYKVTEKGEVNGIYYLKAIMEAKNMENKGENSCYCIQKTPDIYGRRICFPNGFCDMGYCLKAPVVLSLPHMLWADKEYIRTIGGLKPSKDKHMSFILLDYKTGTLLQSRKRMQYNIPLRIIDAPSMLPVLWVEETFDLPNHMVPTIRSHYSEKVYYLHILCYSLIGVGVIGGSTLGVYLLFPRF